MAAAVAQYRPIAVYDSTYLGVLADSFASLPTVGNYVIVLMTGFNSSITFSVSDNQGHTYNVTYQQTGDSNLGIAFVKVATSSGTFTVTVTHSDTDRSASIQLIEASGLAASSVFDANDWDTGGVAQPAITTTAAGDLILVLAGANGGGNTMPETSGNYTQIAAHNGSNFDVYSYYKVAGAAGSEATALGGTFVTNNLTGQIIAFKAAAGGPVLPPTARARYYSENFNSFGS